MDSPLWVYLLGLAGMGIYGSRILIQWYMSEKSHRVESPGIYWVLSSVGAVVLYLYGWLRKYFSIINFIKFSKLKFLKNLCALIPLKLVILFFTFLSNKFKIKLLKFSYLSEGK